MDNRRQIKNGALISYVAIVVNIFATLLYTPWMVSKIGTSHYGLYTLAISLISIFLMDFGIGGVVTRYVSKFKVANDITNINNLLGLVFKLFIVIDIVIFLVLTILFFFLDGIYTGLDAAELEQFKALYLIIASFSVVSFPFTILNGIFNAYEYFVQLKLCDMFQKIVTIVLIVAALLLGYGVIALVAVNAIVGIVTIFIKLMILKKKTYISVNFKCKSRMMLREILNFSLWITIIGIAQRLTYNIAPSILGVVSTSGEIAIYSPASAIAGYFYIIAVAVDGLFLPTVFRKISQKKEEDIMSLMIGVGKYQIFILGMVFIGLVCLGKEFMILWMGEDYRNSYYCIIVLVLPTLIEYPQQIARTTIIAKNKVKLQSMGLIVTSVINILLSSLLSYYLGAFGVSLGICITAFMNLIYMNYIYVKVLKFDMLSYYKTCYGKIMLPFMGTWLLVSLFQHVFSMQGWCGLIIKGGVVVLIFTLLSFYFLLNKAEQKKVKSLFKRS